MTIKSIPDVQQTLPGRSRPYRLWTVEHCDWEDFPANRTVVHSNWSSSYGNVVGTEVWTLNVYDVSGMPDEDIKYHALNGTVYASKVEAQRAAFEAGVLAYMVYTDDDPDVIL